MSTLTGGQIIRIAYAAMVDAGATLDESVDDLVADFEAGHEDEDQRHALASYRAIADAAVAAYVADHPEDALEMVMPDGTKWHTYALSFESDGMTYCFNIMATSAYHAALMLEDLKKTAKLDGKIIEVIKND